MSETQESVCDLGVSLNAKLHSLHNYILIRILFDQWSKKGSLEDESAGDGGATLSFIMKMVWLSRGAGGNRVGGDRGYTGGGACGQDPDPELGV